ncbi:MAG: glucose-1-phosphate cytidylyltransferase [Spirochaetae bacterium HGW-Spirochaetae-5]|nr:MAG: glucose-1-phosphate cytidylyltransferase [Spirochaetae bacterium HGW-Spirochaetae-5]
MKIVLLAGGMGTRLSEETDIRPKPMVEIGGKPILWHIMKIYSHYGFNEFIICLGYKGYFIKEYFYHYFLHNSDVTFDFSGQCQERIVHNTKAEPWKVTLVDTGAETMTGGRLRRVKEYIGNETFMMTYGDGVGDVDINELVKFHKSNGKKATLTAVLPSGKFGALEIKGNLINSFQEKPKGDGSWVNGGFFVLEPSVFDLLKDDTTIWERYPLEKLASSDQLTAYKHNGFWKPMDTLRDKIDLNAMWEAGNAPWKIW